MQEGEVRISLVFLYKTSRNQMNSVSASLKKRELPVQLIGVCLVPDSY